MGTAGQLLRRIQAMPINQVPVLLHGEGGTNPLPDQEAREQPLVQPMPGRIADIDTQACSGNWYHPFERLGSAERG